MTGAKDAEVASLAAAGPLTSGPQGLPRRPWRSSPLMTELFNSELVPHKFACLAPYIVVADEIEADQPRVAFMCRYFAYMKAKELAPRSIGSGIWEFKDGLAQRVFQDGLPTTDKQLTEMDIFELEGFCLEYYENYVRPLDKGKQADRAQCEKVYQTAGVVSAMLEYFTKL